MPKVTFVKKHRPKGDAADIPTYEEGRSYDLELSYAEKYKRLGLAVDYVEPAAVVVPEPAAVTDAEVTDTFTAPPAPKAPAFRGLRRK